MPPASSPALTTADAVDEAQDKQAVLRALRVEFQAFGDALPHVWLDPFPNDPNRTGRSRPVCPHPGEPGGVPEGWRIRWHGEDRHMKMDGLPTKVEAFVVERIAGGWALLFFHPFRLYGVEEASVPTTMMWAFTSPTAQELYEVALEETGRGDADWTAVEGDLRAFIATEYDMTDEAEAAEATLIGLGGPITVFPSSLT
jgi:hypothetical protein